MRSEKTQKNKNFTRIIGGVGRVKSGIWLGWNVGDWRKEPETRVSPPNRSGTRLTWISEEQNDERQVRTPLNNPYLGDPCWFEHKQNDQAMKINFPQHILKKIKLKGVYVWGNLFGMFPWYFRRFGRDLTSILARHARAIIPLERPKKFDFCRRKVAKKYKIRYLPKFGHPATSYQWLQVIRTVDTAFELRLWVGYWILQ